MNNKAWYQVDGHFTGARQRCRYHRPRRYCRQVWRCKRSADTAVTASCVARQQHSLQQYRRIHRRRYNPFAVTMFLPPAAESCTQLYDKV